MSQRKSVTHVVLTQIVPAVVGLAVLVASILWLSGFFGAKLEPGSEPIAVRSLAAGEQSEEVHEVVKEYFEEAVGTLKAASRTVVSAKILATIEEIAVSAGDTVAKDQVLARLSSAELEARLQQAEKAFAAAKATRTNAEIEFRRAEQLKKSNAIAQAEYDAANARLLVGAAEQERAQQAVTEAKVFLSYATIRAPKAGRIVDRLAEPGDTAAPGQPLLTLYDPGSLRLEAPVREELRAVIAEGQKIEVHIDATDKDLPAIIEQIVPQAEAQSRSFLVKASVPPDRSLFEGMSGRLRIPAGKRRHLCLSLDAVTRLGQLEFVDVVLPDGTLERRLVKLGRLGLPGRAEVLSGLKVGEKVAIHRPASGTGQEAGR